jgi:class 3 adenylate cyclase
VQLAKRICDLAGPDHTLISDVVKGLCMGRSFQFEELEARNLKGFNQPIKTFIVHAYLSKQGILL